MRRALILLLSGCGIAGCAPIAGDVNVTIAPSCGIITEKQSGGSIGNVNTACGTDVMIDGESDPTITATGLIP